MQREDGWEGELWAKAEQEKAIHVLHQGGRDSLGWVESGYHLTFRCNLDLKCRINQDVGL